MKTIQERSKELDELSEAEMLQIYNKVVTKLNKHFKEEMTDVDEKLLIVIKFASIKNEQYKSMKNSVQKAKTMLENIEV